MAVKVIKNKVFDGKKTYEVGDTITKLSADDEASLVEDGICEYVGKPKQVAAPKAVNPPNEDPPTNDPPAEDPPGEDTDIDNTNEEVDLDSLKLNAEDYVNASNQK